MKKYIMKPLVLSLSLHAAFATTVLLSVWNQSPNTSQPHTRITAIRVPSLPEVESSQTKSTAAAPRGSVQAEHPALQLPHARTEAPPPSQAELSKLDRYALAIRQSIQDRVQFPQALRRRGLTGEVLLAVQVRGNGEFDSIEIKNSSGSRELDQLAFAAADSSNSGRPPPSGPTLLLIPVIFKSQ